MDEQRISLSALTVTGHSHFPEFSITLSPNMNVVIGPNGAGKTALLEIIDSIKRASFLVGFAGSEDHAEYKWNFDAAQTLDCTTSFDAHVFDAHVEALKLDAYLLRGDSSEPLYESERIALAPEVAKLLGRDLDVSPRRRLSFGEDRLARIVRHATRCPNILIADNFLMGLHPEVTFALYDLLGDRQSFLSGHEPALLNCISFDDESEMRASIIICAPNEAPRCLTSDEGRQLWAGYVTGIQHMDSLLRTQGIL